MKHKRNLTLFLLIAIALTSLGYILDKDMPYQKWSTTLLEFSLITLVVFAIQFIPYGLFAAYKTLTRKQH